MRRETISAWKRRLKRLAGATAACAAGAVFSLGFAPWGHAAPAVLALLLLFWTTAESRQARTAAFLACFFALGAFAFGLRWCANSMIEHGHLPELIAWAGVAALSAVLALFWGAAAALAHRFGTGPASRSFLFAGLLVFAEWLRGSGFADFGWLSPGQMLVDTPLAGWAPILGELGMAAWLFFGAAGIAALASRAPDGRRFPGGIGARALCLLPAALGAAGGWSLGIIDWSDPGKPVTVRLAQTDLGVVDAFTQADPAQRIERAARQLEAPWPADAGEKRLVLTAEGILLTDPSRLDKPSAAAFAQFLAAAQAPVLFNGFRMPAPGDWRNTAYFYDAGPALAHVDKRKLVPFGEFVPPGFRWFVDLLGVPLADLTPGSSAQKNFVFEGVALGVLICYENLDGEVTRSLWQADEAGPDLLAVTANLGWFGSAVRPQHLTMTRLRALESARPAVSVNMNGLSAAVGPKGEILALAPEEGSALLDVQVRSASGSPTPFVRWGNAPALVLSGAALLLAWGVGAARRRKKGLCGIRFDA